MKITSKILLIFWILYFYASVAFGVEMRHQDKQFVVNIDEEAEGFSFLLVGHIYGSHLHRSIYPSASLLANIQLLNDSGASFMVSLGDIVCNPTSIQIEALKGSFLSKLTFPVFNAPGNHDLVDRKLYTEYFGKTYFSFQAPVSFFIFLDSEMNNGKIEDEQLDFFIEKIEYCGRTQQIKNIFIFSHRLIWAIGNSPYDYIIPFVNAPSNHPSDANTISEIILPKLKSLVNKNVYFVSGDVGLQSHIPLFYEKDGDSNITYIATGLADTKKDLILKVNASRDGEITFIPISLTGQKLRPVEYYNLHYWKSKLTKKVYISKLIKKGLGVVRHKYFLAGLLSGLLFAGLFLYLKGSFSDNKRKR